MTKNIGIIGVGHFAGYLVEGFMNRAPSINITLSPRNNEKAASLSKEYGCQVATDNQDVINKSDIIILAVRPDTVNSVLDGLEFPENKLVISVVAGSKPDLLKPLIAPANVVCCLPISCAAVNQSPTLLYPHNDEAHELLSLLGTVIPCQNQQEFTTASTYSAFYGWLFEFIAKAGKWGEENGLDPEMARKITEQTICGAAIMSGKDSDKTFEQIIENVATKGGITDLGLKVINADDGYKPWLDAMDAVKNRLSGSQDS
ncbi:NAD(P)-binding domain-containing protein [Pseudemcibacter aquimaris]|uniref:NAD(P)-binding domain-containing protein n=1 Tax=Pseudemcibacter aquimaris TaxID=2857064 RepID=UPI002010DE23|nr:NAD(P)-binding domain-containing protein [Pseudemcibacter aquimaris]MCC3861205.1 NAD(P)-binding domain-containing protein [Pseudemcibacter aquimaris]WDU57980.1 NAD(P)-binding domain-containing protein [Pseudemcibacter aquimaris]